MPAIERWSVILRRRMSAELDIIDVGKVLSIFGRWPSFHVMEVVSLFLDRRSYTSPVIEAVIFVWDYTGRIAPAGHYEQCKHSLISFRFEDVRPICRGRGKSDRVGFFSDTYLRGIYVYDVGGMARSETVMQRIWWFTWRR